MIQTAIFVLTLTWRIARGLPVNTALSSIYSHLSGLKKTQVEIILPKKQVQERDDTTLDLVDYLKEKREHEAKGRVQKIVLASFPQPEGSDFYLN